jgi:3-methyladenine DNA glycosylase AlkD
MTTNQVLAELKKAGSEQIKNILIKHGAKEPFYGVKVEDIKKIMKKVTANQQKIAMELFDSGISEAQYMAGLMADGSQMTKKQLQSWVKQAEWSMISDFAVPWTACENMDAFGLAEEWINSSNENIACSGWSTFNFILATWPDENLDLKKLRSLLKRVQQEIHTAPNRVRYCMNGYVIALGSFVKELNKEALDAAKKIGIVMVDMNGTSCKVPYAPDYIKKVMDKGYLGRKKKTAKC